MAAGYQERVTGPEFIAKKLIDTPHGLHHSVSILTKTTPTSNKLNEGGKHNTQFQTLFVLTPIVGWSRDQMQKRQQEHMRWQLTEIDRQRREFEQLKRERNTRYYDEPVVTTQTPLRPLSRDGFSQNPERNS